MEELKRIFLKNLGFLPEVVSTTEHAYISPPSRVLSSLNMLFDLTKGKKVLRLVMSDTFALDKEITCQKIFIPSIANNKLFNEKDGQISFAGDQDIIERLFSHTSIFSELQKERCLSVLGVYREMFTNVVSSVDRYDKIISFYLKELGMGEIEEYLSVNKAIDIVSPQIFLLIKESFLFLEKNKKEEFICFGEYMESRNRLKFKANSQIESLTMEEYCNKLYKDSCEINMPFENILFVISYCEGSHFGNDYCVVNDINEITGNNCIQLTGHSRDFYKNMTIESVPFYHIPDLKNINKVKKNSLRNITTLPELYIWVGIEELKRLYFQ